MIWAGLGLRHLNIDYDRVVEFGVPVGTHASVFGTFGALLWSTAYHFEPVEVFSDLNQPVSGYDITTLDCYEKLTSYLTATVLAIRNLQKDPTYLKFWKCRITKSTPA